MVSENTNALLRFIENSPSCFHVCEQIAEMAEKEGYTELFEGLLWEIKPGKGYFVRRNGSSVILFRVPEEPVSCFMLCASHSDSPTYKIKDNMELDGAGMYTRLNVEGYGGMIADTWLDRPLSVAGRVLVREGDRVVSRLADVKRDLLMIPNVAPHMARIEKLNPAVDLMPLYGDSSAKGTFLAMIAEAAGVQAENILATDLYLYNRMPGTVWGANEEFISSPKLDDLQCAFSSVRAFLDAVPAEDVMPVCCVFDNEEVGSQSKQGAASTFLADVLRRVCVSSGISDEEFLRAAASSLMISADNAHAVHPNHPEFADPTHRPKMNGGIVVKRNASQRYTTDAISAALFESVCAHANVPMQHFFNRSDMPGGSTLGNIANTQISLNTVDIGMAQLAMHSSYETAGAKDTDYLIRALTVFYGTKITADANGGYSLIYGN